MILGILYPVVAFFVIYIGGMMLIEWIMEIFTGGKE